jgi:hypothetical protein
MLAVQPERRGLRGADAQRPRLRHR